MNRLLQNKCFRIASIVLILLSYNSLKAQVIIDSITGSTVFCKNTSLGTVDIYITNNTGSNDDFTVTIGSFVSTQLTILNTTQGLISVNISNISSTAGLYDVVVNSVGGGSASVLGAITVNNLPMPIVSATNHDLCIGDISFLLVSGIYNSTYNWTPITGLTPATGIAVISMPSITTQYTVTETDSNGCANFDTVTINVHPLPNTSGVNVTGGGTTCSNGIGLPINVTNSQIGVSYQMILNNLTLVGSSLMGTGADITFANQTDSGTYNVIATDTTTTCYIELPTSVTIQYTPNTMATISGTTSVCQNAVSPNITFTGSNGTAPYTFTYSIDGGSNLTVTTISGNSVNVPASTSTVGTSTYKIISVQDASLLSCIVAIDDSVKITVNPLPVINSTSKLLYNGSELSCVGSSNGQITVTASGGTGALQYSKNNGLNYQVSNVFSSLAANTYSLLVKDANLCVVSSPTLVTINPPSAISFSAAKTLYNGADLSCHNGSNGEITITPSGGSGTLMYSKNNGGSWQVSNVFSGLSAATYLIKVKDANNCITGSTSVTINNPSLIVIGTATNNTPICENFALTLGSSATGGTGAYSYAWSGPLSFASANQNPTVNASATSAMSGTYKIIITDANGCKDSTTTLANVLATPHLVSNAAPITNTICQGNSTTITCTNAGVGVGSPFYTNAYSNDFNSSIGSGWSFPATVPVTATPNIRAYNGGSILGNMGAQQAILNLTGLAAHDFIKVDFDLYIHDTWDGNNVNSGPDIFNMKVDGSSVINTTFSNWSFNPYNEQAYPSNIPATNPNFTGAIATNLPTACNGAVSTLSTKYHISRTIAHSASSLQLLLEAVGIEVACNESWSIDNLVIQRRTPAPSSNITWSTMEVASAITVSPNDTTTYTASNGTRSNSITINVNPTPVANFNINNAGQCIIGNNFNLTNTSILAGPGGFTSFWTLTGSNTPTAITTDVNGLTYSTPGTKNTTLQVTSNYGNCSNSTSIKTKQLDITDTVFVTASNNNPICLGESVTLNATQNGLLSGSGPVIYTDYYRNNFDTQIDVANWTFPATVPVTGTPVVKSWAGRTILGNMGAQQAILNLSGLPTHDKLKVEFDLYIHDSWDGNNTDAGPDVWNMKVNGASVINTTFSNWWFNPYNTQAYPNNIPASNPNYTGAVETNLPTACNSQVSTLSTRYHISKVINHNVSSLALLLEAVGIEVSCNESWSIDSLNIQTGITSGVITNTGVQWSGGSSSTSSQIVVTPGLGTVSYTATIGYCQATHNVQVVPVPSPSFTSNNASCSKTVSFNNTNVEAFVTYLWDFGDGNPTYTGVTAPNHLYVNGTYTITLTATLPSGCTRQTTNTITIADQPLSIFATSGSSTCNNGVMFTNSSTYGMLDIPTYLWDFGDGMTSTLANPTHTYSIANTYNVSLTVRTGTSCISTSNMNVNAPAGIAAATSNFTAAVIGTCGNKVTTNNLTSGTGNSYNWDFGDGSSSSDFAPEHFYVLGGNKTITLTVINAQGCTSSSSQVVSISNNSDGTARIVIDFAISPSSTQILTNNSFAFTPSYTNVPSNNPPVFANGAPTWTFGDGTSSSNTNIYNKNYTSTGTYTVRLVQLTTNTGCYAEVSKTVSVLPAPGVLINGPILNEKEVKYAKSGVSGTANISDNNLLDISLYPNPNKGDFIIKLSSSITKNADVKVLDMLGREVYSNNYKLNTNFKEIEINNLNIKSGSYNIIITSNGEMIGRKSFIVVAE